MPQPHVTPYHTTWPVSVGGLLEYTWVRGEVITPFSAVPGQGHVVEVQFHQSIANATQLVHTGTRKNRHMAGFSQVCHKHLGRKPWKTWSESRLGWDNSAAIHTKVHPATAGG